MSRIDLGAAAKRVTPGLLIGAISLIAAWSAWAWVGRNGLMDGYQNEFLHVGNALDLWGAWSEADKWNLRYLLTTNYWPPGFYLWPSPLFALLGASHQAMVLANVGHLALLLASCYALGSTIAGRGAGLLAAGLVSIYPSIFGNLVRYEPNLAVAAWVTAGVYCLVRSRSFADRRWSIAFGLVCGVGLLMDRISLAMFLAIPAVVEGVAGLRGGDGRRRFGHALLALTALALVAGYWHWEFSQRHIEELLGQGAVGEIDAAGEWTEQRELSDPRTWLFYGSTLIDSQAGLLPGAAAIAAFLASLPLASGRRRAPVLVVLTGLALFTIIQKKQAYYTVPLLGCLAVLTADRLRALGRPGGAIAGLLLLAGLHQYGIQLWGEGLPLPGAWSQRLGAPALPEAWVAPRYPQARPPRDLALPIDAVVAAAPEGDLLVFSDDQTWFEGFVVLQLREALPGRRIRGLISDPQGTYEWARAASGLVFVSADPAVRWPDADGMTASLEQHHYTISELPPTIEVIEELEASYRLVAAEALPHGGMVAVFGLVR